MPELRVDFQHVQHTVLNAHCHSMQQVSIHTFYTSGFYKTSEMMLVTVYVYFEIIPLRARHQLSTKRQFNECVLFN